MFWCIMNSHEVFIYIHQGCFAGTGAIVRLPQCQWGKPDGYRKISQCITTTKHSKAKTVCIFLGIYCTMSHSLDKFEEWCRKGKINPIRMLKHIKRSTLCTLTQRRNVVLKYSISQEICTRCLLCCALLWLYIAWFSHIHQAYFTGTVAI